jgi:GT2 family glycosyltransferase
MEILRLASKEKPLDCIASVILYKNPPWMIENVMSSFLDTDLNVKLYIIDNSPTPLPNPLPEGWPVFYHHVGQNLGYGKAHNWCIRRCEPCKYFLVLNPDVIISKGTVEELSQYLDRNPDIGMVCPRVLNKDQTLQYLNKRRPNLTDLFLRRFYTTEGGLPFIKSRLDHYEMRDIGYDKIHEIPFMTGAFMFCRMDVLKKVGGFDPKFFMYFEDADLSRKFQNEGYKTIYYPHVNITHFWKRESQKSFKMALVFMISGMKYFNKWGWKLY